MTYEDVAAFAASWGIVYFVILFALVLVYALNPKSKEKFEDAAQIPLREEEDLHG